MTRHRPRPSVDDLVAAMETIPTDAWLDVPDWPDMVTEAETGSCDLCGQEMIRTPDDCWHPWNVEVACPPEPTNEAGWAEWLAWFAAGNRTGRPGAEHFRPTEGKPS